MRYEYYFHDIADVIGFNQSSSIMGGIKSLKEKEAMVVYAKSSLRNKDGKIELLSKEVQDFCDKVATLEKEKEEIATGKATGEHSLLPRSLN